MDLEPAEVARRQFDVTRKGYDRDQVAEYLQRVGTALARWQSTARSAETRVAQLERELNEIQSLSENGFHQLVASNVMEQAGTATRVTRAPTSPAEAERIISAANDQAIHVRQRAETALEDALATTALIEEDQQRLLDEAEADRTRLLAEAEARAERIVAEAREVATKTRADAQRFAEELRELTAAETIELVDYAKRMAATILDAAGGAELVEDTELTIDLRKPLIAETDDQPGSGLGGTRPSRYESRSARLPQIGDEGANEAIDSVESLRERGET